MRGRYPRSAITGDSIRRGNAPPTGELSALGGEELGKLGKMLAGIGGNLGKQGFELGQPSLDGLTVEEIGVISTINLQLAFSLDHVKGDVEVGKAIGVGNDSGLQPFQFEFPSPAREIERGRKQRHAA